jgi:hypothetical protein
MSNTRRRRRIQVMGAVGSDSRACSPWPGAGGEDWLSTMWWRCFALAALAPRPRAESRLKYDPDQHR